MSKPSKPRNAGISNPEYIAAMRDIRRSSAASPQESRNKRLRTREAILRREIRDAS
jgi:hypothetical protein